MSADNLMNLLNALTETSVYVIDERNHQLLYFNKSSVSLGSPVIIMSTFLPEKESYPLPSNSSCNSTVGMAYPRQSQAI